MQATAGRDFAGDTFAWEPQRDYMSYKRSPRCPFSNDTSSSFAASAQPLLPAFWRDRSSRIHRLSRPDHVAAFLDVDLDFSRFKCIEKYLWMTGRKGHPRPLHRSRMLHRRIVVTEQADLHLTWLGNELFLKPLPRYLLDVNFWDNHLYAHEPLYGNALGLLRSYVVLVASRSDLDIAVEAHLLPETTTWAEWTTLSAQIFDFCESRRDLMDTLPVRFRYGELRLQRLNIIYRLAPELYGRFVYTGFYLGYTEYGTFFTRNISWMLTVLLLITTLLSALQVGLASPQSQDHPTFASVSWVFSIISILAPIATTALVFFLFVLFFLINLFHTLRSSGRQ